MGIDVEDTGTERGKHAGAREFIQVGDSGGFLILV